MRCQLFNQDVSLRAVSLGLASVVVIVPAENRPSLTMPAPVKHFVSVVLRALGDERHFGLEETIAITITKARV